MIDVSQTGGLADPFVPMLVEEAAGLCRSRYGLDGDLLRFATEKDDTFRVRNGHGEAFILKIANPGEAESEVNLQTDLLHYLAKSSPHLRVPRIIPDLDGNRYAAYVDAAGQRRLLRMMTFLPGTPLSEIEPTSAEREKVGEVLGSLRLAMSDFSHPADCREIAWDIRHLGKLSHLVGHVEDSGRRSLIEGGMRRFREIESDLTKCRMQMLHNDFSRSNIVVDRKTPEFVSGIIDFGDAVRTAVAVDVSTALLNQLSPIPREDLFADAKDVLRGYLRIADLTEDELRLIPHLVMGRVIARALLTTWRARLFPDNAAYILRNTYQGWHQLQWFLDRPFREISNTLA